MKRSGQSSHGTPMGLPGLRNKYQGIIRFPRRPHTRACFLPGMRASQMPEAGAHPGDITSSLRPGLQLSSWPEASPVTPQLAPTGSCRRPGGPGQWGQLKKKGKAKRVRWSSHEPILFLQRKQRAGRGTQETVLLSK